MVRRLAGEKLVIDAPPSPGAGIHRTDGMRLRRIRHVLSDGGTIASQNLNILRAQVYTARNGIMIDSFRITDSEGVSWSMRISGRP